VAIAAGNDDRSHMAAGAEIVPLRPAPLGRATRALGLQFGIRRALSDRPGAVLHAFGCMPTYLTFAAITAARLESRPVIWTPMFHPLRRRVWQGRGALEAMRLFDALAPRAARGVDIVAAATEAEAGIFERLGARRVELLPPVVDAAPVLPPGDARDFRRTHRTGRGPLVTVVASRDEPRKGLRFAFDAFERLRVEHGDATLLIVGLDRAKQATPKGVRFTGKLSDADLVRALRAADVVFVPSLFEAFSRVVIEAWQQRTAVVVSDGVALAPTVSGAGGIVVPYGDAPNAARALSTLLRDRKAAAAFGKTGRRIVEERFLLGPLVDRLESLYAEIRRTRPTGRRSSSSEAMAG
jgi:glycosyltransferase involved in cell wall biosynthesis